jgi:hypothetical protein
VHIFKCTFLDLDESVVICLIYWTENKTKQNKTKRNYSQLKKMRETDRLANFSMKQAVKNNANSGMDCQC